ncbi:hypothetical protein [Corallococcus llansteffanensis]|uniref:DUF3137 domain-containing protein n=1 Tax=Corallococcus llansteffanensis TaxID=2316731 RepID=A0A3A8Q5E0_9BACT|nr:hypothetical protein [Corallococcus llansteffanensis]RKH63909.1 hypothetical protein D7V93_08075 [Corallococcus llansteffanensis]
MSLNPYQIKAPVPEVLADLEVFRRSRALPEVWIRRVNILALGLGALCVGASFFLSPPELIIFGFMAFATAGVMLGWRLYLGVVRRGNLEGLEEAARRQELVSLLLKRLQVDLMPGETLDVWFRSRPSSWSWTPPSTLSVKELEGGKPWDAREPWLTLEARLVDGARLKVSLVKRVRSRQRTTKRPDGVVLRRKVRSKLATLLSVRLRVKPERHPGLAALTKAQALPALRLPHEGRLRRLDVSEDRLQLKVRVDGEWRVRWPGRETFEKRNDLSRTVTMMLLSLYQMLHVARTLPGPEPKSKSKRKASRKARGRRAV